MRVGGKLENHAKTKSIASMNAVFEDTMHGDHAALQANVVSAHACHDATSANAN